MQKTNAHIDTLTESSSSVATTNLDKSHKSTAFMRSASKSMEMPLSGRLVAMSLIFLFLQLLSTARFFACMAV